MPTNLTDALLSSQQKSAVVRTGVVTDWNPLAVQVNVGGIEISAAYLDWYQTPVPGDLVALIQQGSTWLVLGRYTGGGINLVSNPSFEDSPPAVGVPLSWQSFTQIGGPPPTSATIQVIADGDAPQAGQVVQMTPGATPQDVILTSSAISVQPGESYFLSAYVSNMNFVAPTGAITFPPHNVQLVAAWFSTDVETFPSATQTHKYTMVQRIPNIRRKPPYTYIRGAVQVPSTAPTITVMRVGLRVEFATNGISSVVWDYVTARRSE